MVGAVVVAVARQVLDPHLGVGQARLDQALDVRSAHRHGSMVPLELGRHVGGSHASCAARKLPSIWGAARQINASPPLRPTTRAMIPPAAAAPSRRRSWRPAPPAHSGPGPRRTTSRAGMRGLGRPSTVAPLALARPSRPRHQPARHRPSRGRRDPALADLAGTNSPVRRSAPDRPAAARLPRGHHLRSRATAEPAQALAQQHQVEAGLGQPIPTIRSTSSIRPTPPTLGSAGSRVPSVSL